MNTETNIAETPASTAQNAVPTGPAAATSPALTPLPGESDRAFETFRIYMELGPSRRFALLSRKTGVSLRTIRRWAGQYDWVNRLRAHTAQRAEDFAASESAAREQSLDIASRAQSVRERQWALLESLYDNAERYVLALEDLDVDQLRVADVCKVLQLGMLISRDASKDPDAAGPNPAEAFQKHVAALLAQARGGAGQPAGSPSSEQPFGNPGPFTPASL